jgi:hypothetical protein
MLPADETGLAQLAAHEESSNQELIEHLQVAGQPGRQDAAGPRTRRYQPAGRPAEGLSLMRAFPGLANRAVEVEAAQHRRPPRLWRQRLFEPAAAGCFVCSLFCMAIFIGFGFGALGTSTVRTPFSNVALMSSARTSLGIVIWRWKLP